jgi:hypothetical protein
VNASGRDHRRKRTSIHCAECKRSSGLYWHGWRAFRTDDPELGEAPALAFYCPSCGLREFGPPRKRDAADSTKPARLKKTRD